MRCGAVILFALLPFAWLPTLIHPYPIAISIANRCVEVPPDMTVIQQGDDGDHFYIVEDGSLDVFVKIEGHRSAQKIEGATLQGGDSFGELALMYSKPR